MQISDKLKKISLQDIKPYKNNIKIHSEEQIEKIKKSIENNEYVQPICVDKNNEIVIGHGRYFALRKIKPEMKVEVVYLDKLSDEKINKLRILDNKLNESDWSLENLESEIKNIYPDLESSIDKIVSEIDMKKDFIKNIILKDKYADKEGIEDDIPETEKHIIKKGDLIELDNHRILCGDSCDTSSAAKLQKNIKADMIFADPPYNINYTGGTKKRNKIKNDAIENFYEFLYKCFRNMRKMIKEGRSIYICHADTERINFTNAFINAGFKFSSVIIWVKNCSIFGRQNYFWKHEPILYGWDNRAGHKWYGNNKQDTVWVFDRPSKSNEISTMKPIKLIEKAIKNSSEKGHIILDAFIGSGSTLIAAEKTGRICQGIELDPHNCDIIIERYCNYVENYSIKINGRKVNWKNVKKK